MGPCGLVLVELVVRQCQGVARLGVHRTPVDDGGEQFPGFGQVARPRGGQPAIAWPQQDLLLLAPGQAARVARRPVPFGLWPFIGLGGHVDAAQRATLLGAFGYSALRSGSMVHGLGLLSPVVLLGAIAVSQWLNADDAEAGTAAIPLGGVVAVVVALMVLGRLPAIRPLTLRAASTCMDRVVGRHNARLAPRPGNHGRGVPAVLPSDLGAVVAFALAANAELDLLTGCVSLDPATDRVRARSEACLGDQGRTLPDSRSGAAQAPRPLRLGRLPGRAIGRVRDESQGYEGDRRLRAVLVQVVGVRGRRLPRWGHLLRLERAEMIGAQQPKEVSLDSFERSGCAIGITRHTSHVGDVAP